MEGDPQYGSLEHVYDHEIVIFSLPRFPDSVRFLSNNSPLLLQLLTCRLCTRSTLPPCPESDSPPLFLFFCQLPNKLPWFFAKISSKDITLSPTRHVFPPHFSLSRQRNIKYQLQLSLNKSSLSITSYLTDSATNVRTYQKRNNTAGRQGWCCEHHQSSTELLLQCKTIVFHLSRHLRSGQTTWTVIQTTIQFDWQSLVEGVLSSPEKCSQHQTHATRMAPSCVSIFCPHHLQYRCLFQAGSDHLAIGTRRKT